jgi:hypothetical protein
VKTDEQHRNAGMIIILPYAGSMDRVADVDDGKRD